MSKIGFNNFKVFGEKMQYFSQKPITLIYGQNSVGKSSLLQALLYLDYLRNVGGSLNLDTSNFAGDELNLGGFENFIHLHDTTSNLNYEIQLTKPEEISQIIPLYTMIKTFESEGLFNLNLSLDLIKEKLMEYDDELLTLQDKVDFWSISGLSYLNYETLIKSLENTNNIKDRFQKLCIDHINTLMVLSFLKKNSYKVDIKNFKPDPQMQEAYKIYTDRYLNSIMHFNQHDLLGKFITSTMCSKPDKILEQFNFFSYLATITKITLKLQLRNLHRSNNYNLDIYFNDEYVMNISDSEKIICNENTYLYKIFINKRIRWTEHALSPNDKIFEDIYLKHVLFAGELQRQVLAHPLYQHNYMFGLVELKINTLKYLYNYNKNLKAQYYGPLRFYPQRWDMFQYEKQRKQRKFYNFSFKNINLGSNELAFTVFIRLKILLNLIYSFIPSDIFNKFRSNKKKHTFSESNTAEQMWEKLISNPELVDALNVWFSKDNKIRSTYEVRVEEVKDKNLINRILNKKLKKLRFIDKKNNTDVTPRDMGLGISQILPILLTTLTTQSSKIYTEQPELHLHPAIQMEIMDEFIKSHNLNKNTYIIESHSEHILLRIMKRMRQTVDGTLQDKSLKLTPDDICLLYVDNNGQTTYIKELELDNDGTLLDPWPHGFFEEGYKERFE